MLICNHINYTVLPLHVKEFKTQFQDIVNLAQSHKGCHKFDFFQYDESREKFMLVEIFKSEKNEKKFKESKSYQELLEKIAPLIESHQSKALRLTTCLTKQSYWQD